MKYKMYAIFALESVKKMNGVRGKLASMSGHAYLHAYWDAMKPGPVGDPMRFLDQARAYRESDHAYKITLIVDTVDELKALQEAYKNVCGTSLVTDAGFTVFDEPTTVCLGIGPIREDLIGDDIKALKTFC
jgi:peptidyl-tRNA hydrolase